MIKKMIEYGYKYIGVIPVDNYKIAYKEYANNNKPVLILYPDNTEAYVEDSSDFFRLKDTVMYGLERSIKETRVIIKAIRDLEKPGGTDVLSVLGFSDEEIEIMMKEADLGIWETKNGC